MKIVVCSDNHGYRDILQEIRLAHPDAKAYIHCGDSELPNDYMDGFVSVAGNNDYWGRYPENDVVEIDGLRIFVTHSHLCGFGNQRLRTLVKAALARKCSIVCYGHTHVFAVDEIDGITLVNPGALRYPRDGKMPCYSVLHIENGQVAVERIFI